MNIFNKQDGQSLIEAVISLSVAGLIVVALVAAVVAAVRNVQFSRRETQAVELNRQAIEWLRSQKKVSWSEFASNTGTYCFNNDLSFNDGSCSGYRDDGFKREGKIEEYDSNIEKRKVIVTTTWQDYRGDHSRTLTTYLTKW